MRPFAVALLIFAAVPGAHAGEQTETAAKDFITLCTNCHGVSGTGDGPMAKSLRHKVSDLTRISARNGGVFPEDHVFETIAGLSMPDAHGNREMPVWGDLFVTAEIGASTKLEDAMKASDHAAQRIVGLVRYIEQMQVKP